MIDRYELDIHSLDEKKTGIESEINMMVNDARNESSENKVLEGLTGEIQKLN